MTTYGTIPTSSSAGGSPQDYISRAKERGRAALERGHAALELGRTALATLRPWREMVPGVGAFGVAPSLGEAYLRIRTNGGYFSTNYAIVVLLVVFISLLWHPISLIVFLVMMAAWLFLYFLRDEPLVILHRTISDRYVLIALGAVTFAVLLFTSATVNILVSLAVGLAVVLLHAALRKTEDLGGEDNGSGWYAAVATEAGKPFMGPS